MTLWLRRRSGFARLLTLLLVLVQISCLGSPALAETTGKPELPGATTSGTESGTSGGELQGETTTTSAQASSNEDEDEDDEEVDEDEDEDDEDGDRLYSRTPRSDRPEMSRTVATLVGGLALGLIGYSFGPIGFLLGGALGAGIAYLIAREIFPYRHEQRYQGSAFTDPYYDSYYGPGSQGTGLPSGDPGNPPSSQELSALQTAYFETLTEYRNALRGGDLDEIQTARAAYTTAYQELSRARAAGLR